MTTNKINKLKTHCLANNWVKRISDKDTEESLMTFFENYSNRYLWLVRMTGDEWLLDFSEKDTSKEIYIYNCKNPDRDICFFMVNNDSHYWWHTKNVMSVCLKKKAYPEITDGKVSLYLDEFNINSWLKKANEIKSTYGSSKIPGCTVSGEEYFNRIKKMVDISYGIMDRSIVPNIFQVIPIKKNHTYQAGRTIPIFSTVVNPAEVYVGADAGNFNDEYIDTSRLELCISSEDVAYMADCDITEECSSTRAKLLIRERQGVSKICLLNKDMSMNDIVSKAKNLKDEDVIPGRIYAEKKGTEYLFLGNLDQNWNRSNPATVNYIYMRWTKKLEKIANAAIAAGVTNIDDFNKNWIRPQIATGSISYSDRMSPRKFVKEVKKLFDV